MVARAFSPRDEGQVNAIALGAAETDPPETVSAARAGTLAALSRARSRLSRRLLTEMWTESANLDVAIWGPLVSDVEAGRYLRDAAERGVIYLDPAPPVEHPSRLRRLVRRLAVR
jgi:aryl-alcohol dehydrogenase-like predicted oxidoreductase